MNETIAAVNKKQLYTYKAQIKYAAEAKARRRSEQQKISAQDCYGCQKAKKDKEGMFGDYPDMPYQFDNMTGSMNL